MRRLAEMETKLASLEAAEKNFLRREEELLKQVDDMRNRYENLKEGIQLTSNNSDPKAKVQTRFFTCIL